MKCYKPGFSLHNALCFSKKCVDKLPSRSFVILPDINFMIIFLLKQNLKTTSAENEEKKTQMTCRVIFLIKSFLILIFSVKYSKKPQTKLW